MIKYIIKIILVIKFSISFFLYKKKPIFHLAIVRYIGTTLFAEGIWIGIEFISRSLGKNDGSVNGHTYFECKQNHGLFIRPNRITLTKK